jgi:hypothetical protein
VVSKGLTPLADLLAEFRGNGGKIWLRGACTKPRESPKLTRPRVPIVGAAAIIEAIANGAIPIAFA